MISINNLSVEFSARPLFSDVSFVINKNDKIGLAGKNGAGKSTMLKILAGIQQPDNGSIGKPSGITIGYLPQQMNPADDTTLIDETRKAFSSQLDLNAELDRVNNLLAETSDYESDEYLRLIDRMNFISERLEIDGAANREAEIERTLTGLGFAREDFNRPTKEFSGGWRMRVELAKILLQHPDVLLLDEPTNHLDIESIQWLEQFLTQKAGAVVLVSHDRAFLDNVTKRTIEISCGKIYDYKASYTTFTQLRRERVEQQLRAYENQQKLIADTRDFIERFRYKPTKAVQVQSRIKMLEKIVPIEVDEVDNSRLNLKFPPATRSGDFPLIADGVGKSFGDHHVFSGATFTIRRGEKVAFVGKNGEGKSTLVKCIMSQLDFEGELRIGHNVRIGYFAQNQAQLLDQELTVFETIDRVATGDVRNRIRDILGAFMFGGEDIDKKVTVLSGGEKTRLAMIRLLLEPVNFLILDEPTNHLDLRTKDILKEAIRDFNGTVVVVSHDRDFLDGLVDKVYEFGGGKVTENLGGIYDFLRHKNLDSLHQLQLSSSPSGSGKNTRPEHDCNKTEQGQPTLSPAPRLNYAQQKERDKLVRRAEKAVKTAEEKIAGAEQQLKEVEDRLSAGESSPEILAEYDRLSRLLETEMSVWEVAQQDLDDLRISLGIDS